MARRIGLALALHNHQPVGNFGWVIADTYERAYLPMLEALERHPAVRLALHYTGPLLAWLRAERPEFLERLAALFARNQVELLGGGWYEPVLASLPERDRIAQLERMASELEREFGRRPTGAWLAERVWEPDLPTSLVDAGYAWTILDDAHFRAAAIPEDDLWGPFTTDDQGRRLVVWGTEQGLRYHIPFHDLDDVLAHLRAHATEAGDRVGMMGDDGEKFGGWPSTWEHCWRDGWVERFFTALEANADWLRTVTPSDWLADHPPIGRVYLPTGSYAEMGEWALPAEESVAYADVLHAAQAARRPEARWLRGAIWRNFQVKYREINDLHKQMLAASDAVAAMAPSATRERALDHLLAGQSNDPYWHGLFGGVYLADLRVAVLRRLIAAADLAAGGPDAPSVATVADVDLDGRDEVLVTTPGEAIVLKPDDGAGIGRWDILAGRVPLAAVLRRRPEAYHARVRALEADTADRADGPAVRSIHDIATAKQAGLADLLRYDDHERRSGLVRWFDRATTAEDVAEDRAADLGDFVSGSWRLLDCVPGEVRLERDGVVRAGQASAPVHAVLTIRAGGVRLEPVLAWHLRVTNRGEVPLRARLASEWSTMLLGGGGNPAAWLDIAGTRTGHDARREATGVRAIAAGSDQLGVRIETAFDAPVDAWIAPILTVSNSEGGFEQVYQGSGAWYGRIVELGPGEAAELEVVHRVVVAADLALADLGGAE